MLAYSSRTILLRWQTSRQNATKMMTQRQLVLPAAALCSSILFRSASSMSFAACKSIRVRGSGETAVNGVFSPRNPSTIPAGFDRTCVEMGWPTEVMWKKLSDGKRTWFESENESYIYWNQADGKWWIDEPSGAGKYIVFNDDQTPPEAGWAALPGAKMPLPTVEIIED